MSSIRSNSITPSDGGSPLNPPSNSPPKIVVTQPSVVTATHPTSPSTTHTRLPPYHGGPLLSGYCITPEFTLVSGPQSTILFYVPFIGCIDDKPDCCPFSVTTSTTTVTELGFPTPPSPAQSTLTVCPDDYHIVNSVCCPL